MKHQKEFDNAVKFIFSPGKWKGNETEILLLDIALSLRKIADQNQPCVVYAKDPLELLEKIYTKELESVERKNALELIDAVRQECEVK
jgi:hypothetical protein